MAYPFALTNILSKYLGWPGWDQNPVNRVSVSELPAGTRQAKERKGREAFLPVHPSPL